MCATQGLLLLALLLLTTRLADHCTDTAAHMKSSIVAVAYHRVVHV
jgi:hypothetical protein